MLNLSSYYADCICRAHDCDGTMMLMCKCNWLNLGWSVYSDNSFPINKHYILRGWFRTEIMLKHSESVALISWHVLWRNWVASYVWEHREVNALISSLQLMQLASFTITYTLINKCYDEADPPYPLGFWHFLPPLEAGLPGDFHVWYQPGIWSLTVIKPSQSTFSSGTHLMGNFRID